MSERGSFVTEYIYNREEFHVIEKVLFETIEHSKYFAPHLVGDFSIIAGKIGGTWPGNEFFIMEEEIIPELEKVICRDLRIAVISDCDGERFYTVSPINKGE